MSKFSFALLVISALLGGKALGQVNDNFESGVTTMWTQQPVNHWAASTDRPISGIYSLKHTFDNTLADVDYVGLKMNLPNIAEGNVKWRFLLKHGYAPSATNRWSVFLMSSASVAQMKSGDLFNGYSVGINTKGSDDFLRIYKHSYLLQYQATEVLLETPFNWETEVGTAKAAAIEIERTALGDWTLRVSKDGLFANLITLGTFQNSDFGTMQNFVVAYSYTASADKNLWLDDISIAYTPLNSNNRTSTVQLPTSQVVSQQILTTDTTVVQAKEVLRFIINDKADGDGLPTKPTHLKFLVNTSAPDLNLLLGSIVLKEQSSIVPLKSFTVSKNSIEIKLDEGVLQIEDGTQKELSLWTTIRKNAVVPDHTAVSLEIPITEHGWIAAISGSGFASTFAETVVKTHTIEVEANKLSISEQPSSIQKGKPFSITVNATDNNLNKDIDNNSSATLSLDSGGGSLTIPDGAVQSITNGVGTWENLTYSGSSNFSLKVASALLGEATSESITFANDSTSAISLASIQPATKVLTPGCESTTCAIELMRLALSDIGGDGVPTIVTQIKLINAAASSAADWTKVIRFFAIKINGREISLGNPTITKTSATIPILPGDLLISEGESAEISIFVGLKSTITDGELVQIMVESPSHGFTTAASGSAFGANLPQALTSSTFEISIEASKLTWKKIPTTVAVNELFDVEANATDQLGNLDLNFNQQATLAFTNKNGVTTTYTTAAAGGKAIFIGIALPRSGEYSVSSSAGNLTETPIATLLVADKNSTITASANTLPSATLYSNKNGFIPIISIDINDFGTTDTLPTIIAKTTLKIVTSDTLTTASPISEVVVKMADGTPIPTTTDLLTKNTVEVSFTNGFAIPNNSSKNIIFYAKPTKFPVIDNAIIQFKIPAKECGWTAASNSTQLVQLQPFDVISPKFTLQVEAKTIQPQVKPIISANELPAIVALATDSLGNIDTDYAQQVELALTNISTGEKRDYTSVFTKGKANVNSVGTLPAGTYSGVFSAPVLPPATFTFEVSPTKTCLVNEDFELGILPASWLGITDWKIDQTTALGSPKSIRHNGRPNAKTSTLSIPLNANLTTDSYTVSIAIKTGSWAPSLDNNFCILLTSYSSTILSDTVSGYAIGVNQAGDDDILKIWQVANGKASKTLLTTNVVWKENTAASINLTLLPNGKRILTLNGKEYSFIDLSQSAIKCLGLKYNYTSTRAGMLWADDISFCQFASGPRLISANRIERKTAMLQFSEPVSETTLLDSKIHLWTNGNQIQPSSIVNKNGVIYFTATTDLPQKAVLSWKKLTDSEGTTSSDSLLIEFEAITAFSSIVFNEIMADPTPTVGLPECEYIELYNRSIDTLSLNGWMMQSSSSITTLRNVTIKPHQYLLLTTTTCATQAKLSENGAVGVTSFPSLTNGGATLTLKNPAGAIAAQLTYSDEWYRDALKKEGGYSLEKIDTDNLSEEPMNWKASTDADGGTPGRANSVMAANPDITPPTLEGITVIDKTSISLRFSEPLLPETISSEKFIVENSLGGVASLTAIAPVREIKLTFSNEMVVNTIYNLTISGICDFAGNSLATASTPFAVTELPKWQDIVINELLFNPFAGGADFIEIHNRSSQPFNLTQLKLYRRDNSGALISGIRLSSSNRLILAGEYYAFTPDPESINQHYSCQNRNNLLQLSIPAMNDDQGTVVLTDTLRERVDEVTFTDKMHYPLLASTEGVSLERVNPEMPSDKASSWQSASQLSGFATPTAKNSCYRDFNEVGSRVTIDPELFSPDGDGYHDVTYIRLKLPEPGWNATITIYDSKGREVRKLLNNALIDVNGEIAWTGLTNDNQLADMGIYVVLVEMFHLSGEVRKEKKVVVVGGRL